MASVSDPSTALRSEALDAFLDHVDTLFNTEDDTQEWPARQAAAAQQLASRALEPEDLDQLRRVYRLWSMAGQPAQALAAVQQHQARLLQELTADAQRDAAVTMAMLQADAAEDVPGLPREQYRDVIA